MTPIYFYVLIGSVIVPMLFSIFAIDFIKSWKSFSISTIIVAVIFLVWDMLFTRAGIWGFNHDYCLGIYILGMPLEEWLFFLVIPFCSLFTHYAFFFGFSKLRLPRTFTIALTIGLVILAGILVATNFSKAYTAVNFSFLVVVLLLGLIYKIELLQRFYISFLVVLIPFFIVNGILTGALTVSPIVWYDNLENLGIRLVTIPIEDIGYAFTMLFGNLMIFETLNAYQLKLRSASENVPLPQ